MSSRSYGIAQSIQYVTGQDSSNKGLFSPVYDNRGVLTHLDNCVIAFGRNVIDYGRLPVPTTTGKIYAEVKHPTYGETLGDYSYRPDLTLTASVKSSSNTHTCFPLYEVSGGAITKSYIGMAFIPVYS